jgi:hypothetical protein
MSRILFEYSLGPGGEVLPVAPDLGPDFGTPATRLGGRTDQTLDPVTHDYVRTPNGEWAETADSRTIFLIAVSTRLGQSPFDPGHGTSIYEIMRAGALVTPEVLQSETVRVGSALARDGVLSDLVVAVRDARGRPTVDEAGRTVVKTSWRDLASGSPIDQAFSPG